MRDLYQQFKLRPNDLEIIDVLFPDATVEIREEIERDYIKKIMIVDDKEIAEAVLNVMTLDGIKFTSVDDYERQKIHLHKAVFLINRMNDSSLFDDELCVLVRNEIANHKTKITKEAMRFINV